MAELCKLLRVLPREGGLLDQDWYHVKLLRAGLIAFSKKEEFDQKQAEAKAKRQR